MLAAMLMHSFPRIALVTVFAAFAGSCSSPVVEPPAPVMPVIPEPPADARIFDVEPGSSELQLYVYRDGRLAELGHNHVVVSAALEGRIYLADSAGDSFVDLVLPVASLAVDPEAARAAAGEDFSSNISEKAKQDTRNNMLGPELLKATEYPEIRIRSIRIDGAPPEISLHLAIEIAGAMHTLDVPASVGVGPHDIYVRSRFSFLQTELGLTPFSALMGSLLVRDQVDARILLVAKAR